jgi:hypothetical protein
VSLRRAASQTDLFGINFVGRPETWLGLTLSFLSLQLLQANTARGPTRLRLTCFGGAFDEASGCILTPERSSTGYEGAKSESRVAKQDQVCGVPEHVLPGHT